jgi:hypothetical protein
MCDGRCRNWASVRSECTMPRPAVIQLTSPGADGLHEPETVAVHQFTDEEVGDGREADVRVRTHIDAGAGGKLGRTDVIEKDERPDEVATRSRQHPSHFETAQVPRSWLDDPFNSDSHACSSGCAARSHEFGQGAGGV